MLYYRLPFMCIFVKKNASRLYGLVSLAAVIYVILSSLESTDHNIHDRSRCIYVILNR